MTTRKPFTAPLNGDGRTYPHRFIKHLGGGWYLVERMPHAYHCRPIDGWRVGWWLLRTRVEAVLRWFDLTRL